MARKLADVDILGTVDDTDFVVIIDPVDGRVKRALRPAVDTGGGGIADAQEAVDAQGNVDVAVDATKRLGLAGTRADALLYVAQSGAGPAIATAGRIETEGLIGGIRVLEVSAATGAMANADDASVVLCDHATDIEITIPPGLQPGRTQEFVQMGAGRVILLEGTGVTFLYDSATYDPATAGQYSSIVATGVDNDNVLLRGQMADAGTIGGGGGSFLADYSEVGPSTVSYSAPLAAFYDTGFEIDFTPSPIGAGQQYIYRINGSNWLRLNDPNTIRLNIGGSIYNIVPSAALATDTTYTLRLEYGVSMTLSGGATGTVSLAGSGDWSGIGTADFEVGREAASTNEFPYGTLTRPVAIS